MPEKRKSTRFKFRFFIQYEKALDEKKFDLPVTAPANDISSGGISFFSDERMTMYCRIRVTVTISQGQKVSFICRVVRIEISKDNSPAKFLIGAMIETR